MRLSLDPIYDSNGIALILAVALIAILLLVTPSGTTPRRRRVLLLLRSLAALALIIPLIRPALVQTDSRPTVATLIIAADTSRSMNLGSGEMALGGASKSNGSQTRWEQQQRLLESLGDQLRSTDASLNVALYRYDETTQSQGSGPSNQLSELVTQFRQQAPSGNLTDLGGPLRSAVEAARTSPLAGIALISDGTQTGRSDEAESNNASPLETATMIGAMGVPVWTVSLGPDAAVGKIRDVAVTSLPETYRLFSGNEVEVAFELASQGYANKSVSVALTWIDRNGKATKAASRSVNFQNNRESVSVRIPVLAPEPAQYRLLVETQSAADETDTSNDRQLAFVDVREGGGRVLYLESTPRMEQMFLRRALRRFPDLELSYRWIPRDTSARWPIDLSDDLQSSRFDVVILGDVHSAAIGDDQQKRLAEMVASGTGLVTLGGQHSYGPGGYANSPLAKVLPVEMDANSIQRPGVLFQDKRLSAIDKPSPGQWATPFQLNVTRTHPITNISPATSSSRNFSDDTSWSSMPPMLGANLWSGPRVGPGVQVLLDAKLDNGNERNQPMMVVGEFGAGRVASIAFDSTWTWSRGGMSEFHRRFWRQTMLWLLSREEADEDLIQVEMMPRRFIASAGSEFTASLRLPDVNSSIELVAEIEFEDGSVQVAPTETTVQSNDQVQILQIDGVLSKNLPPGIHTLKVRPSGGTESVENSIAATEMPFQVIDDTRELVADIPDHAMLDRLASATSAAGGEAFRADQVDQLVQRITQQRRRAERVVINKKRLGDDPATGWIVFVLFAGALSMEWYLRRQWGLA